MSTAPAFISLGLPGDGEKALVQRLSDRLALAAGPNEEAEQRYEGSFVARQVGFSIPPSMRNLDVVAGWPGTVVDVLEERLDWLGWTPAGEDELGLSAVYDDNALDVDSGMAHLDALIFGVSFVSVGTGGDGEPSPLVATHSPLGMTGEWDRRARRLSSALTADMKDGALERATLYLPDETVTFEVRGGAMAVVDRDRHRLGRVPVVLMPNRARGSRATGRSEITKAVRYYTDAAVRTLLGLEVNREFYNAPQRIGLNIDDSMFEDEAGNPVSPWTSIQGRLWNVPPNEEGLAEPKVMQFPAASPAPYIDQIQEYAARLAAEAGMPESYVGLHTSNPSSADAIRAGEARLVKRAERRQSVFGRAWLEVARLALLVRDGEVPDDLASRLSIRWRDAATPTRAAAADEALKLTSGDSPILPPDSTVTYDRIGLTPAEQRQVMADKRRNAGRAVLAALPQANADSR